MFSFSSSGPSPGEPSPSRPPSRAGMLTTDVVTATLPSSHAHSALTFAPLTDRTSHSPFSNTTMRSSPVRSRFDQLLHVSDTGTAVGQSAKSATLKIAMASLCLFCTPDGTRTCTDLERGEGEMIVVRTTSPTRRMNSRWRGTELSCRDGRVNTRSPSRVSEMASTLNGDKS